MEGKVKWQGREWWVEDGALRFEPGHDCFPVGWIVVGDATKAYRTLSVSEDGKRLIVVKEEGVYFLTGTDPVNFRIDASDKQQSA